LPHLFAQRQTLAPSCTPPSLPQFLLPTPTLPLLLYHSLHLRPRQRLSHLFTNQTPLSCPRRTQMYPLRLLPPSQRPPLSLPLTNQSPETLHQKTSCLLNPPCDWHPKSLLNMCSNSVQSPHSVLPLLARSCRQHRLNGTMCLQQQVCDTHAVPLPSLCRHYRCCRCDATSDSMRRSRCQGSESSCCGQQRERRPTAVWL